jgi:aspartate kinase
MRLVQKFGGSSVADAEKMNAVADRVAKARASGVDLVVVVSAQGDTTDDLLARAKALSDSPPSRELDMLLSCGERISMALLSICLNRRGVPAISLTGSQSGIITDETHAMARIIEIRPTRIEAALAQGLVVIVAGYQGVSTAKEVTTLGRGGSDTTAVALAAALGADCEIYSDVDGVFSADPRVVGDARRLDEIGYDEMIGLASSGAKVLNAQAVEFAKQKSITITAKKAHGDSVGTRIGRVSEGFVGVRGIAVDHELWLVESNAAPLDLLDRLGRLQVSIRSSSFDLQGKSFVTLSTVDLHREASVRQIIGTVAQIREDVACVSCVGSGLERSTGVTQEALRLAQDSQTTVFAATSNASQVSLYVERSRAAELARAFHRAFIANPSPPASPEASERSARL